MIGPNIKKFRQRKKITQKQLAEKLGVSRQALCMWEADKRELKATTLRKVAKLLSVTVNELMKESLDHYNKSIKKDSSDQLTKAKFIFMATQAKNVCLAGDFNNWDKRSLPMKKRRNGIWSITLLLESGEYEYKYLVDNIWHTDPNNNNHSISNIGSLNSVLII